MGVYVIILSVIGLVNTVPIPRGVNDSCTRQVVYNVTTLKQTNNCCHNVTPPDSAVIAELKSQFLALHTKVQDLEKQLQLKADNNTKCLEEALITGPNPVKNHQLSASGTHMECSLQRSRLYTVRTGRGSHPYGGGWCVNSPSTSSWIQVDIGREVQVTSVATQGRNYASDNVEWVKTYTLSFSQTGSLWTPYSEEGSLKVFGGNWDSDTLNKHLLRNPFRARFVRLHPKTWNNWISLRWEVYGC